MNDNRTDIDDGLTEEPALTQKNTETVRGEEILADEGTVESNRNDEPGVRSRTSYGAAGGTTDATEEGGDGTGI